MDKLDIYKIDLKGMSAEVETRQFSVDDTFFEAVQGPEIQHGRLDVEMHVKHTSGVYVITFQFSGIVEVMCDRCLEPMELPVDAEAQMRVKMGDEYADDGELITIPADDGTIDVAWNLYEFIALEIPLKHVHPDGECNGEMSAYLDSHAPGTAPDDESDEEIQTDPRWDKLKEILDNNLK